MEGVIADYDSSSVSSLGLDHFQCVDLILARASCLLWQGACSPA